MTENRPDSDTTGGAAHGSGAADAAESVAGAITGEVLHAQPGVLAHLGPVRQLGFVVDDIEKWMDAMTRQMGMGPWTVFKGVEFNCVHRGVPGNPCINVALAYTGELQFELIQPLDDRDSPYRHFVQQQRFGLHHTAYLCADIEADVQRLEAAGLSRLCDIQMPSGMGRYVYFESPEFGDGYYVELLEATTMMKQMFAAGVAAVGNVAPHRRLVLNTGFWLGIMKKFGAVGRVFSGGGGDRKQG